MNMCRDEVTKTDLYREMKERSDVIPSLEELEKKVDKHNSVVERTYGLEEAQAVLEEKIKVANHRIEDLENLENRA